MNVAATYIHTFLPFLHFLAPPNFRCLSLAQAEHTKHASYPPCYPLDYADVHVLPASADVDVRPGHQVPKNIQSRRRVVRIAQRRSESVLRLVETKSKRLTVSIWVILKELRTLESDLVRRH